MDIGQLAKLSGAGALDPPHYEKAGLIVAARCAIGYRDVCPDAVDQVRHIVRMIRLSFPLQEIATFAPGMLNGQKAVVCPATLALRPEKLAEIERQIGELETRGDRLIETLRGGETDAGPGAGPGQPRKASNG